MIFFHDVFDALFRLCADSEANVQNAAQFLDNLVKVRSNRFCIHMLEACCLLSICFPEAWHTANDAAAVIRTLSPPVTPWIWMSSFQS